MSTGPGPTRKAEGSANASVDDVADLLVEEESPKGHVEGAQVPEGEQLLDDSLDVMLETPGPVVVNNTFMPPPPTPAQGTAEETDSGEDAGSGANLAYEDLLAKLVLPAKASEAEPAMPAVPSSVPHLEATPAPAAAGTSAASLSSLSPFKRPSSASLLAAPPSDERTVVTDNPLVAEEQEAAVREGRQSLRDQPLVVVEEMRAAATEPISPVNGGAKSRLLYLMLGGLLVLGGMILAVLVLKLLMPTPAAQPPVVITPAPAPQPLAPPAHVEPLPPTAPPAAAAPAEPTPSAAAPEDSAPTVEEAAAAEVPKAHKRTKTAHVATAKPTPAPKAPPAPKPAPAAKPTATKAAAAPAPAAKPTKKSKGSGYADPFDN